MNLDYFRMINNTYKSKSKQETDLYLLNRHIDDCFADTIDYHIVKRNGEPFELLIIKDTDGDIAEEHMNNIIGKKWLIKADSQTSSKILERN